MKKVFTLKLKSLEYAGDSIGNDVILEIQAGDQSLKTNPKINRGDKLEINQEIGYFETKESSLELPTRIKIIEKDILFDDVGYADEIMKIDQVERLLQSQSFEMKVSERRGVASKRAAIFRVTIEVAPAIRFVEDVDPQGWLIVRSQDNGKNFSIPLHCKVQIDGKDGEREYFTILAGVNKNTKASVSVKESEAPRFAKTNPHKKAINLTYSISKKTLRSGKKIYKTVDYVDAPWVKGVYRIEIPDYPHKLGGSFVDQAPHATTWFRTSHLDGDRYLHTGGRSLGCITVAEKNRWDEIYAMLITARSGDDNTIGTLKVID